MDQENKNNEETNLNGTFKDSSKNVKSQNEQQQSTQTFYPDAPKIIKWVVKYSGGLIKDDEEATYILLWFVAVSVIISLFLIFSSYFNLGERNKDKIPVIPAEQNISRTFSQ